MTQKCRHTYRVLVTLPFLFREQVAEGRVSESNRFVSTQLLHSEEGGRVEFDAVDILLEARHSVFEIDLSPIQQGVNAKVRDVIIRVWAGFPRCKAVEEPVVLYPN